MPNLRHGSASPSPPTTRWRSVVALAACCPLIGAAPAEEPFPGVSIDGANTVRLETYGNSGDDSASPYPYEGAQYYDEWGLNFEKRNSLYDVWRGQFYGVLNGSDYRSTEKGAVPERFSILHEKGDGSIPYRVQAGDYFGYYSYLTLQRSLKGAQLELQPHVDAAGRRHSIVLTTGSLQPTWLNLDPTKDIANGVSWLIDGRDATLSLNFVNSHRDGSAAAGTLDRDQYTFSMAGETEYRFATQRLAFEGELAHLVGDIDASSTVGNGQDRNGNGVFLEMRGQDLHRPLDYRARFEYYSQDFQPHGGVITADRRSAEFHAGWRFSSGLRLSGRLQDFEDSVETANPLDTRTVGVNLSGPLFVRQVNGLVGSADAFVQDLHDKQDTIDQRVVTATLNLSKPLPYAWYGRLAVFLQDLNDRNATDLDTWTGQYLVSADHSFTVVGLSGVITPGIMYRNVNDGASATNDWSPTLGLQLGNGRHSIGLNYGYLRQDRHFAGAPDVNTHTLSFGYRYTRLQHTVGVDLDLFGRAPNPGRDTEAYRVGVFWTFSFDRRCMAWHSMAMGSRLCQPNVARVGSRL